MSLFTRLFFISLLCFCTSALAETLFLFGGGSRPQMALKQFVTRVKSSPILIITWSTTMPDEVYKSIANDLKLAGAQKIEQAPQNLKTRAQRKLFFDQVDQAGGIFFSGGDQNLALDIIDQYDLRDLFKDLHQQGIPFAGTSAGTALMPEYAMVGGSNTDKPRLREGLGLIEYFVDQHFIVRGREPRLKALVLEHQISGIGIDEGMAALVESGVLHSIGPTAVEILQIDIDQILKISLKNGQRLRLDFQNQLEQTLSVR